jgi:hypothetical protein
LGGGATDRDGANISGDIFLKPIGAPVIGQKWPGAIVSVRPVGPTIARWASATGAAPRPAATTTKTRHDRVEISCDMGSPLE